ncbi:hypothetical protein Patl1_31418 [Pistacia atlantica]|uniref:Uncharacterized protein n=1 Tax=Pistacia atlantica TaxID=434234 RepID=A0ACC1AQN3_9ROSI|nr:hypothetical protein Patl1_31418 [Pistacia atlantica]
MEDSVPLPGAESLLHPENPSSIAEIKEAEEIGNNKNEAKGGEQKPSGFINNLISNLVTADEPDNKRGQKKDDDEQRETMAEGKGEEKGGGLLDHLISNLVSPLSPKAGDISQEKGTQPFKINGNEDQSGSEEHVASSPSNGGLIKNVISNFFHHPTEADEAKDQNEKNNEEEILKIAEENHHKKQKTEESGGVSIIDNIVSHLPTSLREDVAPTADEASILIHSIIHD